MAVVQHKNIPDADLHQAKGASAATVGQMLVAKGDGTATFQNAMPRGSSYFVNLATPYTLAYPSAYAKLAPTTTSTALNVDYTVSSTGRLTYTGTRTLATRVEANISFDRNAAETLDLEFAIYKNGSLVTGSTIIISTHALAINKIQANLMIDVSLATNDYVEVYVKNDGTSGDIRVYSFYLTAVGMQ